MHSNDPKNSVDEQNRNLDKRRSNQGHNPGRRKVVKKIVTGIAGTALIPASVAAADYGDDEFRKRVAIADRIARHHGIEARTRYLEDKGYPTGYKQFQYTINNDENIGTNRVDCVEPRQCDGDIDLILSISYNSRSNEYYVSTSVRMRFEYRTKSFGDWGLETDYVIYRGGEDPADGIGFQWKEEHWKVADRDYLYSSVSGDRNISWDNGSWNRQGMAFKVDDLSLCDDSVGRETNEREPTWSDIETCGIFVEKGEEWEREDAITASYVHTWEGANIDFGVSWPFGLTVTSSSGPVRDENLQTDLDGKSLRVNASDTGAPTPR